VIGDDKAEQSLHDGCKTGRPGSTFCDARSLPAHSLLLRSSLPAILHYVGCGLNWLRDKYEILGSFPDSWLAGTLPIAPSFHLDARDAAKRDASERSCDSFSISDSTGENSELVQKNVGTTKDCAIIETEVDQPPIGHLQLLYQQEVLLSKCTNRTWSTLEKSGDGEGDGDSDGEDCGHCEPCSIRSQQTASGVLFRLYKVSRVVKECKRRLGQVVQQDMMSVVSQTQARIDFTDVASLLDTQEQEELLRTLALGGAHQRGGAGGGVGGGAGAVGGHDLTTRTGTDTGTEKAVLRASTTPSAPGGGDTTSCSNSASPPISNSSLSDMDKLRMINHASLKFLSVNIS